MSGRPAVLNARGAIPRLTHNEAEARTLVAQNVRSKTVRLGAEMWCLDIEPLGFGSLIGFDKDDWHIQAFWAGAPYVMRLPQSAAEVVLAGRFPDFLMPDLPQELRAASFEVGMQDVCEALEQLGLGPVRVDAITNGVTPEASAPHGDMPHVMRLSLSREGRTVWALVQTNTLGLMVLGGLAARFAPGPGSIAAAAIPVCLRAVIGRTRLSMTELRGLQVGDAILMQEQWASPSGEVTLRHGDWGMLVSVSNFDVTVIKCFQPFKGFMDNNLEDDFPGDETGSDAMFDGLPVVLHFDVGQLSMPLAQVCELQVGQVVDLARPLSHAVSIRANGELIGKGELIEIGGRLAISITSLHAHTNEAG